MQYMYIYTNLNINNFNFMKARLALYLITTVLQNFFLVNLFYSYTSFVHNFYLFYHDSPDPFIHFTYYFHIN